MQQGLVSITHDQSGQALAGELAALLDAAIITAAQLPQTEYLIEVKLGKPGLKVVSRPDLKPIIVDFSHARKNTGKDPLLRAIGAATNSVIDATAGWCSDAVHLARHGLNVVAIEQNKMVAALSMCARRHISDADLKARFTLLQGNSITVLERLAQFPDVVYLDPMYPEKNKSAAVKKELAVLQQILGPGGNDAGLFDRAMQAARRRVVVKRPHYAAPIAPGKTGETRTKSVRFDIYRPDSR